MIEWDEVLEDVDWKRGAAFLIGGILVITAFVVVGLDWHRYNQMKTLLTRDLESIQDFQNTWTSSSEDELNDMREEEETLEARLAGLDRLPLELNSDDIKKRISQAASSKRVEIIELEMVSETTDGYCLVLPFEVVFTSKIPAASANFLSEIAKMPEPHSIKSKPITLGGTNQISIEFYAFDKKGWEEINNCQVKLTVPEIPYREMTGVRIFKSRLNDLHAKVDQESASLTDVKRDFTDSCELENKVNRLRAEFEIIQEKY